MNRLSLLIWLAFNVLIFSTTAQATCGSDCAQYCGPNGSHGYCTDYIQSILGSKQTGDAGHWIGNVDSANVEVGDVAIFDFGSYGHVAIVENVDGDNITISEWNWGSMIDANCAVTDSYGETTNRVIAKSSVTRFWRPSNNNPQTEQEVHTKAYANSGRLAWLPLGSSCKDATKWIDIDTGTVVADKSIQSVDGNYVCENYGIYPNCSM